MNAQQIETIPLTEIVANPNQPRKEFPEEHIRDLAQSIVKHGLLQPIALRRLPGGGYMIIAGECRFRAHQLLAAEGKLSPAAVKAIVHDVSEAEMALLAIIENAKRRDVNPIEEANAYQQLIEAGMDAATIAAETDTSVGVVNARLALLKLDSAGQTLVRSGQLSASHGAEIAATPARYHAALIRKVGSGELKTLDQVRAACSGIKETLAQGDIFGSLPAPTAAEERTIKSMETRIAEVAAMVSKGWKDGECQIAKKVDPNRATKLADQIKAIQSALVVMEYDLRKAAAAGDLLQGIV